MSEEEKNLGLHYIVVGSVWFANVYDLIVGEWFYNTMIQVMFLNVMAMVALYIIIKESKKDKNASS